MALDNRNLRHYGGAMRTAPRKAVAAGLLTALLTTAVAAAERPTGRDHDAAATLRRGVERVPATMFGVNGQWLHLLTLRGDHGAVRRHAQTMQRLGIGTARVTPQWNEVERIPPSGGHHHFDFARFDQTMSALARSRIRAAAYLIGVPSWARGLRGVICGERAPPTSPADFATYAGAVVDRYGRGGSFWGQHPRLPYRPVRQFEVWNEPNLLDYWCPAINPAEYADLFVAAARRIHQSDPRATVVFGGLSGVEQDRHRPSGTLQEMEPGRFLALVVSHRPDARSEIDAVGLHTYAKLPAGHIKLLRHLRRRMGELSLGLPIVYNEFGWPTRGARGFVTGEKARAAYTRRVAKAAGLGDCGVISVAPYTWATREMQLDDAEDWYGIVDPLTARPYRTARSYSELVRRARGLLGSQLPLQRLQVCGGPSRSPGASEVAVGRIGG